MTVLKCTVLLFSIMFSVMGCSLELGGKYSRKPRQMVELERINTTESMELK